MKISNLKFGDLQVVESGKDFGPMSMNPYLYPNKSLLYIKGEFMANRMNLGAKYGFCGRHMFIVKANPTNGDYLVITKKVVEDNFSGFPTTPATSDVLIISSDTPDVVIGGLHKEMPIILAYDRKERVLGAISCPDVLNDQETPSMLIDAMTRFGLKEENIYAYIGRSTEDIIVDDELLVSTDMDRYIELDQFGTYHINPKEVIKECLLERGIKDIETSKTNTLFDYDSYYGFESGYNFTGGFIMSENNVKRLGSKR